MFLLSLLIACVSVDSVWHVTTRGLDLRTPTPIGNRIDVAVFAHPSDLEDVGTVRGAAQHASALDGLNGQLGLGHLAYTAVHLESV